MVVKVPELVLILHLLRLREIMRSDLSSQESYAITIRMHWSIKAKIVRRERPNALTTTELQCQKQISLKYLSLARDQDHQVLESAKQVVLEKERQANGLSGESSTAESSSPDIAQRFTTRENAIGRRTIRGRHASSLT